MNKEIVFKGVELIIKYCKEKDLLLTDFDISPFGDTSIRFNFCYRKRFECLSSYFKDFNFNEYFILDKDGNFLC